MSPEDLKAMAEARVGRGYEPVLVLTVPKKRAPGLSAALLPGLNGRCVAWDGQRATIMVNATDVLAWFARRPSAALSSKEREP
jgi:hypothetical protein